MSTSAYPGPASTGAATNIPDRLRRRDNWGWPGLAAGTVVRHVHGRLVSDGSADTLVWLNGERVTPPGRWLARRAASWPAFALRHPDAAVTTGQGMLQCVSGLQDFVAEVTGLAAVSLAPPTPSLLRFAAVSLAFARLRACGVTPERVLVCAPPRSPWRAVDAAGSNLPIVALTPDSWSDADALAGELDGGVAAVIVDGVGPEAAAKIAKRVQQHQPVLLIYGGGDFNAWAGRVTPAELGYDAACINVGLLVGGAPVGAAAQALAVGAELEPWLPLPRVTESRGDYRWLTERVRPQTIGRLSATGAHVSVLLQAYVNALALGSNGIVSLHTDAIMSAYYLEARLRGAEPRLTVDRLPAHGLLVYVDPPWHGRELAAALFRGGFVVDFNAHDPQAIGVVCSGLETKRDLDAFSEALASLIRVPPKSKPTVASEAAAHQDDPDLAASDVSVFLTEI
ncbi:MAG: hypothetical protein OES09_04595 [Gammaproteobacteria bacterium]|nr:hypothetical protein [Gammaproteobacteria bacterium]